MRKMAVFEDVAAYMGQKDIAWYVARLASCAGLAASHVVLPSRLALEVAVLLTEVDRSETLYFFTCSYGSAIDSNLGMYVWVLSRNGSSCSSVEASQSDNCALDADRKIQ